jgi:hypothetical protein
MMFRVDLQDVEWEGVDWSILAQEREQGPS